MQRLLDALLLAGLIAMLLCAAADAAEATPHYARVVKLHGASLRIAPSSDAREIDTLDCGQTYQVLRSQDGWFQIADGSKVGWVGGGRVSVGSPPAAADCTGARTVAFGMQADLHTEDTCLNVRSAPSDDAPIVECVADGRDGFVEHGPIDPGSGIDWVKVELYTWKDGDMYGYSVWVPADDVYMHGI